MRAAMVFNPTKVGREELALAVEPANDKAGYEPVLWLETTAEDPGVAMGREAAGRADVVLAVGGDGTVRGVAEGLRGSGVPLALCPHGTGNLLARNLGLPLNDLAAAVDVAYQGTARPIDLGMIELRGPAGPSREHAFLVMAGVGLDATIMATTDPELKARIGMLAYVKAGADALPRNEAFRIRYRLGSRTGSTRVNTLLIGNCGSIGGGVQLMPDAQIDDGLLDVLALRPKKSLGWLRVFKRVLVDHPIHRLTKVPPRASDEVRHAQVRRFEVRLRTPREVELDGDPMGKVSGFSAWVDPGALRVLMPAGDSGRGPAASWLNPRLVPKPPVGGTRRPGGAAEPPLAGPDRRPGR